MSKEEICRVCLECGTDVPDDAVPVEDGIWWVQAEGRLIVNAPLALGEFGDDVLAFMQDRGLSREMIRTALLVVAAGRFESAFPACAGKSIDLCPHVGLPLVAEERGGAA